MKNLNLKSEKGQALITLLFFVVIGITVISATTLILFSNISSGSTAERGIDAYYVAESGAESGILRLLRNPIYSSPQPSPLTESFSVDSGQAEVSINNGIVTSKGTYGNIIRKIQVQTVYNNGAFTISSWKEIN